MSRHVTKAKITRRYSRIAYLALGLGLLAAAIGQSAAPHRRPHRRAHRPRDLSASR